jgi:membrane-bound ClpP family serine protease
MRHPASRVAAAAILLALLAATARAANIEIENSPVSGVATISIDGKFELRDGDKFQDKSKELTKAIVLFRSNGGNVIEAIKIGEALRRKGFSSLVLDQCASACALAWLGATQRFMADGARIGFHAVFNTQSGQESGVGNAVVGAYLRGLGLPYQAVIYVVQSAVRAARRAASMWRKYWRGSALHRRASQSSRLPPRTRMLLFHIRAHRLRQMTSCRSRRSKLWRSGFLPPS